MTKGRMLHGILPFFCAGAALLLRSRVRSSNSAAAVGVQTHRAAEVGHGARVIRLVAALGLSKAYFDVLLLLLRDDGVRVDRLVDQSPSFFPHGGLAAVLQGDGARRAAAVRLLGRIGALRTIDARRKLALQGYLWVTGTPFSLEYPSLRGGFGWHDISWKHHFQV